MYTYETKIYIILLIAAILLAFILLLFILTINRHKKQWRGLFLEKMAIQVKTQEQERKLLAANLHDDLSPLLVFANMQLDMLSRAECLSEAQDNLQMAKVTLNKMITRLRQKNMHLWNPLLDRNSLSDSVTALVRELNNQGCIQIVFVNATENLSIPSIAHVHLYRIIQELSNNTIKHAGIAQVHLVLRKTESLLLLSYRDDGKGFQLPAGNEFKGTGILSICNRVSLLKGELFMETEPGQGFYVRIRIPLSTFNL